MEYFSAAQLFIFCQNDYPGVGVGLGEELTKQPYPSKSQSQLLDGK